MINDKGELVITWCVEDVLMHAKSSGVKCSKKKAAWVLERMDYFHDCAIGITWEVIDFWLNEEMPK